MKGKYQYFNRDLSWLYFNHRVLEEAKDESLPLYERIKFLAIYSNNLEEFYRVRLSYYRKLLKDLPPTHPKIIEVNPEKLIREINGLVSKFQTEFSDIFRNSILPQLKENGINLLRLEDKLSEKQELSLKKVFEEKVLLTLEPMVLIKRRVKPFLRTGQVYIVFELFRKGLPNWAQIKRVGLIKLPTDLHVPRFIELPPQEGQHYIMFLEDLILRNIEQLYPGYKVSAGYNIKVTRDADLDYEDYEGDELVDVIERIEATREIGAPNRFQYDGKMPDKFLNYLIHSFGIEQKDIVRGGSIHNFRDFFGFPNPKSPELDYETIPPLRIKELDNTESLLEAFAKKDYCLHFPFQTYNYFIRFLLEAAHDSNVTSIQATQYRVASNSAVVNALMEAAENGKNVTVFVELKARFDEETNLKYAQSMKKAGIKIIYSIQGLKVHSKVAMVTRVKEGKETSTAFLGTGNFNEKTAKLYTDHGLFTSDNKILSELKELFNYLEDQTVKPKFKEILVPNFNMVETYKKHIQTEINNVKAGYTGYICLKMNGLEDPITISYLYEASEAGVKIDLIVRGVCRLIPEQPYSKNIRVIRIIDRYLEHDRVFLFHNRGNDIMYMGSADWMRRNLYRRIECVFPIKDPDIKKEMMDILNIQLSENVKARMIDANMKNIPIRRAGFPIRSQLAIYQYLKNKQEE